MNIIPIDPPRVNYYYTGVFKHIKNSGISDIELVEVKQALSGSRVEDYFPMVIEAMNKRGNWQKITTENALTAKHIDFSWTNSSKINTVSGIHSRLQLDSVDNYISNKKAFYERFKHYDFIPKYMPFTKDTKKKLLDEKFVGKAVIIKPDLGSVSSGIMVQKVYNYDEIMDHIKKWNYKDWTVSEITIAKLIDSYIVSNRIYFLVTKTTEKSKAEIKGYVYQNFMNYRAENKFEGDITDPNQFLTNYYSKIDLRADEMFVRNRYIPNDKYMSNFSKEDQVILYDKINKMFEIIVDALADDCMSDNENKSKSNNSISCGFHIYGADVLIDDNLNIKIIEMNGAPAMNIKSRLYGLKDRLDYFDLFEEAFQKIIDPIYPPLIKPTELNVFKLVNKVIKQRDPKKFIYYIPNSIVTTYPFILDSLRKRLSFKRTKNMHDTIDLFYGLRERYVVHETSMNYYDEILNFLTSKRMRKASIINKIQGVTYYLANKGRMYNKLLEYKPKEEVHKYHPVSKLIFYDDNDIINYDKIDELLNEYPKIKNWIIKPIHGSRGKGIEVFRYDDKRIDFLSDRVKNKLLRIRMADYICQESKLKDENAIIKRFDGMDLIVTEKVQTDKYWIVSEYIDNPHLLKLDDDLVGRKYNIRAYVLIVIDDKLPTYGNINSHDNKENIKIYMYNDMMIYYSMLEYKEYKDLPEKFKGLNKDKYLNKMINLTNLEVVNNVYDELGIPGKTEEKRRLTSMLSKVDNLNKKSIKAQAKNIIKDTINSVKYDLRPLNRHNENYKGAFNLLAYDLLLDDFGILNLIEINRGPDLKGLEANIGYNNMIGFFDGLFDLTLERSDKVENWKKILIDYQAMKI